MQVFLIEEKIKPKLLRRFFKIIEIKNDKIILNFEVSKCSFNKKAELCRKIKEILDLNLSNKIILSKKLKQDKDFKNLLYSKDIYIMQGKILFKILINKIVEKICVENKIKPEESKIAITINDVNNIINNNIEDLAKKFKIVSIVTNNINRFKDLQKKLLDEQGIVINITNNKKKSLINSKIILNVDFPEEVLNRYVIEDASILINLEEEIKINKKNKIINDFDINLEKDSKIEEELSKEDYEQYDLKDLLEVYLINYPKQINDVIISK